MIQATAFDHEASSEDMRHLIHEHYVREDDCYLFVSKYISELDELKIVKAFAPQRPHLDESKRIEANRGAVSGVRQSASGRLRGHEDES